MANQFPFKDPSDVMRADWKPKIVDWFCDNYEDAGDDAIETISQLLDHVFQFIKKATDFQLNRVKWLGEALKQHIPDGSIFDAREGHYSRILVLLELGLSPPRSTHLFMVPEIDKDNLLSIDGYSILFLGINYHAAGDHSTSTRLLELIAEGCPLAKYVIGQNYRRRNRFEQAHLWLDQCIEGLEAWEENHSCPFNRGQKIICSEPLIRTEALRAKGVVFRRQGRRNEAKISFHNALDVVNEAINMLPVINTRSDDDQLRAHYRVKADVCYSYGYCLYEERDYQKAEEYFKEAIEAIEKIKLLITNGKKEEWDPPYTRLGVIYLCLGRRDLAAGTFTRAYNISSTQKDREAPLSKALCSLGLQVIDICYPGPSNVSLPDPMEDLENALNLEPKLDFGPLECHKEDAEHFLIDALERAEGLVNQFIDRLEEEILAILPNPSGPIEENPRVLIVGASPVDQQPIDLIGELNAILNGLRQARHGNKFDIRQELNSDFNCILDSLLQHRPHIVHIITHVDERGNTILVKDGFSEEVSPDRLGALLGNFRNDIRCVILSGCCDERTVRAILPYVEPIVAMCKPCSNRGVPDSACINFSGAFYGVLGTGMHVQSAFNIGRVAINQERWRDLVKLFWQWNNPRRIQFVARGDE